MQDMTGFIQEFWFPTAISVGILLLTSWLWSIFISTTGLRKIRAPVTVALSVLLFCIGAVVFVIGLQVQTPTESLKYLKYLMVTSSLWLLALSFLSAFFQERLQEYQFQARWLMILEKLTENFIVKKIAALPSPKDLNSKAMEKVWNDLWAYAQIITNKVETRVTFRELKAYGNELYLHYDIVNKITFKVTRRHKKIFTIKLYLRRVDAVFSPKLLAQYSEPEDKWNLPFDIFYFGSADALKEPINNISAEIRVCPNGERKHFWASQLAPDVFQFTGPEMDLTPNQKGECEVEWTVQNLMHPAKVKVMQFGATDVIVDEWTTTVETENAAVEIRSVYAIGSPLLMLAIEPVNNRTKLTLTAMGTTILPQDSVIVAFDIKSPSVAPVPAPALPSAGASAEAEAAAR